MDESTWTPVTDIQQAYDTITATFLTGKTRDLEWRKEQIRRLGAMVQENESAFVAALQSDFSRPAFETLTGELAPMKAEILEALHSLDKWAKPERVKTSAMWYAAKPTVYYEPKGAVLVIGTWNYPITLLLTPLLGAISAGCTAIIKPAEQAPSMASLIARLIPSYLDPSSFLVITGGVPQTSALLEKKYSHIFYTGSGRVGRIVAKAAAEHLTPTTLELGGKSPAVVLEDADVEVAGRRIAWAKYTNAGQICIAPDYVLTTPTMEPKIIASIAKHLRIFAASSPLPSSAFSTSVNKPLAGEHTYPETQVITRAHYERLVKLLGETKGEVVVGGGKDEEGRRIEITVVRGVKEDDSLMSEEIFGPLLPVVTLPHKEAMVEFINAREVPLAIYVFTNSGEQSDFVFQRTRSGTFLRNDLVVQFIMPGLPFGGTGESGYGGYHGRRTFLTFSHERAAAHVPNWMDALMAARYPPYTDKNLRLLRFVSDTVLPTSRQSSRKFGLGVVLKLVALVGAVWAVVAKRGSVGAAVARVKSA
ncbi:hypothetical protein JCM8097_004687 [Rhodosporidiobolus ruineniae]